HGQDDDDPLDPRPDARPRRPHRLRRQDRDRAPAASHRPARHRPGAGGAPMLRQPDGRGEPPRLRPARRLDTGEGRRSLSPARRTAGPICRYAVRRRAADAGDRPRPDDQSEAPHPRRGDRGAGAGDPTGYLGGDPAAEGRGPVDPRRRQDALGTLAAHRSLLRAGEGPHGVFRPAAGLYPRPAGPLSRRLKTEDGMLGYRITDWDDAYENGGNIPGGTRWPAAWVEPAQQMRTALAAEGRA